MRINYNPSEKSLKIISKIKKLRENGVLYKNVIKKMGFDQSYIYGLMKWDRENRKEVHENA